MRERAFAAAAAVLSLLGAIVFLRSWRGDLGVPLEYFGDVNLQHMLVRSVVENGWFYENARLGAILAQKANAARGPVQIFLPLRGVSILDSVTAEGPQPFWWPEADRALFDALKRHLRKDIPLHELDCNVNDEPFARATAGALL